MLDASETKRFKSLAATLNCMSLDRSDVQYAAQEVCTKMAKPTRGSWKRLKKAGRYLKGVEKVTWKMEGRAKQRGGECARACGSVVLRGNRRAEK